MGAKSVLSPPLTRRPHDDELDVYGLTHPGKVRTENQDHFLVGTLRGRLNILMSSLPDTHMVPIEEERVAAFMMVADGVGGGQKGEEASRMALEGVARYISEGARCYYRSDDGDGDFRRALEQAARKCHQEIRERGAEDPATAGMATTLTLFIGAWPWSYVLQVGDSRYYTYADGVLSQISRDQTVAQALVDQGLITQELAPHSPLSHVLASSIGGPQTAPVVSKIRNSWENIHLLASDGLTKHVSDDRIAERLGAMQSAKQACQDLLQDALDAGGTDNITVIVGRAVPSGDV
jgi:serine/threonine protein phosphatase PrpC